MSVTTSITNAPPGYSNVLVEYGGEASLKNTTPGRTAPGTGEWLAAFVFGPKDVPALCDMAKSEKHFQDGIYEAAQWLSRGRDRVGCIIPIAGFAVPRWTEASIESGSSLGSKISSTLKFTLEEGQVESFVTALKTSPYFIGAINAFPRHMMSDGEIGQLCISSWSPNSGMTGESSHALGTVKGELESVCTAATE